MEIESSLLEILITTKYIKSTTIEVMDLYSYRGQIPEELPFRIRLDSGETRTSLNDLSKEELKQLGFEGPYSLPIFDINTQKCVWDSDLKKYNVLDLPPSEINNLHEDIEGKNKKIDQFTKTFLSSEVYKNLRSLVAQNPKANVIFSFVCAKITNAIDFNSYANDFQKLFILLDLSTNGQEYIDIQNILEESGLRVNEVLPEKYLIDNYYYDFENDFIIKKCPHKSWIIKDKSWQAPIPYPSDGNSYVWDEKTISWSKV